MTRYNTLGNIRFADTEEATKDIRGSKIYSTSDEKLGKIDDVIFDGTTGGIVYAVVDTGGWLSSHKFIVPPDVIRSSAQHPDDFVANLTKEQIEQFPPYDAKDLGSDEEWAEYERRYRSKWTANPVMHREATDRNITPTTQQQAGASSGSLPTTSDETAELEAPVSVMRTDASMDVSASGPSLRWTTFEDKLRQRREEILNSSIRTAEEEDSARPAVPGRDQDNLRKAG